MKNEILNFDFKRELAIAKNRKNINNYVKNNYETETIEPNIYTTFNKKTKRTTYCIKVSINGKAETKTANTLKEAREIKQILLERQKQYKGPKGIEASICIEPNIDIRTSSSTKKKTYHVRIAVKCNKHKKSFATLEQARLFKNTMKTFYDKTVNQKYKESYLKKYKDKHITYKTIDLLIYEYKNNKTGSLKYYLMYTIEKNKRINEKFDTLEEAQQRREELIDSGIIKLKTKEIA